MSCIRLRKSCEYYPGDVGADAAANPTGLTERLRYLERLLHVNGDESRQDVSPGEEGRHQPVVNGDFPTSYFLDPEYFSLLRLDALSTPDQPFMRAAWRLVESDWKTIYETYLETVQHWLPMLSRKRLHSDLLTLAIGKKPADTLLILCMKLCTQGIRSDDSSEEQQDDEVYNTAKQCCFYAESGGFVSLRLVQSLVLLAVYELGHAIYPAAYLTIGRASRLAGMMGQHSRKNTRQLFIDPDTWTLREEQRRTWWAIFILDRAISAGTEGLTVSAPSPGSHDLLPCTDAEWNQGSIGSNEPLLAESFHAGTSLGPFAQTCQAAHMLDKVLTHLDRCRVDNDKNVAETLEEAMYLHKALLALDASLNLPGMLSTHSYPWTDGASPFQDGGDGTQCAMALCCSARILLYSEYGCNEPEARTTTRERVAMETEAQRVAYREIEKMAAMTIPKMAKLTVQASNGAAAKPSTSPLLAHCMYHGATECAWFIKENHERNMYAALRQIVRGLKAVQSEWRVGGEYLSLLEKGEVLELVDEVKASTV
ncbi:fungal specific transcription factor [Purpureocillium lavendulum]|uniref:Fungal specific transcription factor n=1 Tax=Purpureocillium lavendulum TaxID=1247861 RepID=A0AB34FSK6_9HYPO|nr:fungal specific transcription factor [Purpureocillium lavendulum]